MSSPSNGTAAALGRHELVDVYLQIKPQLERVISRRIGSVSLAADLAQEMFFRIDAIKTPLPTRVDAERYFLRVAINASLDYLKIESRRRAMLDESGTGVEMPASPSAERIVLARDELRRIDEALSELPEKCRSVFVMSRSHGLSHAQIAAELSISKSLVEKYVIRALLHCRARLGN